MSALTRIYAAHAEAYAAVGLPAFPVDTRHKRPAVKGWQAASPGKALAWASVEKLGDADGLGLVMGKPSGLTEIDVDAVGDAWLALAVQRFGETPITIRTASGKAKLWYRNSNEGRRIRPFADLPIDILGGGFTIAPPSWREDLSASYDFLSGSLESLDRLPSIKPVALGDGFQTVAAGVKEGRRNDSLWRYCMAQARHCDDVEGLIDVAETWSSAFPDPLHRTEVERCARSAWKYETTGRNYLGLRKPQITDGDKIMDALIDQPEAYALYQMFLRWHGNRSSFAIAPRAMSEAGSPPWSRLRIANARDVLLTRGFIEELSPPSKGRKLAGRYRLSDKMPGTGHNHYTPFSLFAWRDDW